jgi:hypothetical protein
MYFGERRATPRFFLCGSMAGAVLPFFLHFFEILTSFDSLV